VHRKRISFALSTSEFRKGRVSIGDELLTVLRHLLRNHWLRSPEGKLICVIGIVFIEDLPELAGLHTRRILDFKAQVPQSSNGLRGIRGLSNIS
jgi:hypothetical protein